eukprot:TRINITY_DN167_c0_g3_i1.p1 TRINITY_DN167_c0_g3~~TRINITY_DN167_c0_g3_i1.p1  ORF type:complete len:295 (+),score=13.62 TRINITY_DN167_c0_g3_i1:45-887(+)
MHITQVSYKCFGVPSFRASPSDVKTKTRSKLQSRVATSEIQLPPLDDTYESAVRSTSFCNWVLPGHLMIGQYPYTNTEYTATHEEGEKKLQQVIEQGVNTFVCLLPQLPPQEKMKMGGVEGFFPYKATAELIAASLSERPPQDVVEGLRNPTIDKFLPPRKRQPEAVWHPINLKFVHMPIGPIKSFKEPSQIEPVVPMIDELVKNIQQGDVTYIHCSGGTGRASVIAACVLVNMFRISTEEALQRTNRGIESRSAEGEPPRSPSHFQYDFVNAYVEAISS